jgi:hypothetical protein
MNRTPVERSIRAFLFAEVRAFVADACRIPGVVRIALIGSLTTEKLDPKDADLLVTITNDTDLEPLARLGRRLQGRAQSRNRGGDVFLADPDGNYLGRTCHWTRCAPGIRVSCDAWHCGRRHYHHDDFGAVRLSKSLMAAPPLELWPWLVVRIPLPEDLEWALPTFPREEAQP